MTNDLNSSGPASNGQSHSADACARRQAHAEYQRALSTHPELAALQEFIDKLDAAWPNGGQNGIDEAPPESHDEADRPSSEFGRFTLREGGFGVVFLAFDPMLDRTVALKLPRLEVWSSAELRDRFLREGKAAAALDHPNILPVHEAGDVGGIGYIVSMYCPGPTLARWMKDTGQQCSPRIAAQIVANLARAVQHAHERGVLHRDIKPSNVLLEPSEAALEHLPFTPRLTDFGLAKQLNGVTPETATGIQAGTPWYMAPEQLGSRAKSDIGVFSDVYSLGVVLYELLTGKVPFGSPDPLALAIDIREAEPPAIRTIRPEVSRDLETICLKCLEKHSTNRYRAAAELADDLQRFLDGEDVLARPLGWGLKWARRCRRHRLVTALCCLVLATLTFGVGGVAYQWRNANRYAAAVEQSLVEAEQGLVNMAWVHQEMNLWSETTDPFLWGDREQLLTYYRRMLERDAPSRPSAPYQATMESFHARVAELSNRPAEAAQHFENTIRLWGELVRQIPEVDAYRQALVVNIFSYGEHLRRYGETDHPLSAPHEQEHFARYLLAIDSGQGRVAGAYVDFLMERGKTLVRLSQEQQALERFTFAHRLAQRIQAALPEDTGLKRSLAKATFFFACGHRRIADRGAAIDFFTATNQLLDQIMAAEPPTEDDLFLRADASRLQAACMRDAKRTDEAVTMFVTAEQFLWRLQEEFGESPRVWNLLASTQHNLAELYESLEKPAHSRLNWERFCETSQKSLEMGCATDTMTNRLPLVLLQLGQEAQSDGRTTEASARFEWACAVFARVDTLRAASGRRRLTWTECLGRLADLALEKDDRDGAIACHERAIEILQAAVDTGGVEEQLLAREKDHRSSLERIKNELDRRVSSSLRTN